MWQNSAPARTGRPEKYPLRPTDTIVCCDGLKRVRPPCSLEAQFFSDPFQVCHGRLRCGLKANSPCQTPSAGSNSIPSCSEDTSGIRPRTPQLLSESLQQFDRALSGSFALPKNTCTCLARSKSALFWRLYTNKCQAGRGGWCGFLPPTVKSPIEVFETMRMISQVVRGLTDFSRVGSTWAASIPPFLFTPDIASPIPPVSF